MTDLAKTVHQLKATGATGAGHMGELLGVNAVGSGGGGQNGASWDSTGALSMMNKNRNTLQPPHLSQYQYQQPSQNVFMYQM